MNIETVKLKIAQIIAEIHSEALLRQLLAVLELSEEEAAFDPAKDPLNPALWLTPASLSLEELKKEQAYSLDKLNQHYAFLDKNIWKDENIHELIRMIDV
ncbi:MAG: hypothetical protein NW226_05315 [Microscillaceae bacterium]|nr:hypothetical protein [Microscillaceae bacterium]